MSDGKVSSYHFKKILSSWVLNFLDWRLNSGPCDFVRIRAARSEVGRQMQTYKRIDPSVLSDSGPGPGSVRLPILLPRDIL